MEVFLIVAYRRPQHPSAPRNLRPVWKQHAVVECLPLRQYSSRGRAADVLRVLEGPGGDPRLDGVTWELARPGPDTLFEKNVENWSLRLQVGVNQKVEQLTSELLDKQGCPILHLDNQNVSIRELHRKEPSRVISYILNGNSNIEFKIEQHELKLVIPVQNRQVSECSQFLKIAFKRSLSAWFFGMESKVKRITLLPNRDVFWTLFGKMFAADLIAEEQRNQVLLDLHKSIPSEGYSFAQWPEIQEAIRGKVDFLDEIFIIFTGLNEILRSRATHTSVVKYLEYRKHLVSCVDDYFFTENPFCNLPTGKIISATKRYTGNIVIGVKELIMGILEANDSELTGTHFVSENEWFAHFIWQRTIAAAQTHANFDKTNRTKKFVHGALVRLPEFESSYRITSSFCVLQLPRYLVIIESYWMNIWSRESLLPDRYPLPKSKSVILPNMAIR